MSTRIYSADRLYPVDQSPIDNGYVAIDTQGKIESIGEVKDLPTADIQHFDGILIPGMVNAHCHLELSHMVGRVDTGTGLLPFLKKVVTLREVDEDVILQAIADQDEKMYNSGISAIGDISNTSHTHQTKMTSPIRYYSFVEMFDFMQDSMTDNTIAQYTEVYNTHVANDKNAKSYVPHAPYTVSKRLLKEINKLNNPHATVSVHNQETPPENELFLKGTGAFHAFFDQFGFKYPSDICIEETSIHYLLQHMDPLCKTLFVHNTLTTRDDVKAALDFSPDIYWATCPNANLYIENRLPDYQVFLDTGVKVCVGTDSLTSNWQLDIWEEVKTILKHQSYLSLDDVMKWATLNGAEALSMDDQLGSLTVGKSPGIVHINGRVENGQVDITQSTSRRVI